MRASGFDATKPSPGSGALIVRVSGRDPYAEPCTLQKCLQDTRARFLLTPTSHEKFVQAFNSKGLDGRTLQPFKRTRRWTLWLLD